MPTCLLVRHGRTTANTAAVLAGWTPGVGLDDEGITQARDLAARLREAPLVLLAVSPLQRCQETADLLADGATWAPTVRRVDVDGLGECRYGAWTNRSLAELAGEPLWKTVQEQPSAARFPPSEDYPHESIAEMAARSVRAIRDLDALVEAEHGADAAWAAVSHGDVIKAIVADAAGAHLDQFQRYVIGPASLSAIRYTPARPYLLRVNERGSVADLLPAPAETAGADTAVGGSTR